jgi:hypothetical protein
MFLFNCPFSSTAAVSDLAAFAPGLAPYAVYAKQFGSEFLLHPAVQAARDFLASRSLSAEMRWKAYIDAAPVTSAAVLTVSRLPAGEAPTDSEMPAGRHVLVANRSSLMDPVPAVVVGSELRQPRRNRPAERHYLVRHTTDAEVCCLYFPVRQMGCKYNLVT